jgi:hypothetical protein
VLDELGEESYHRRGWGVDEIREKVADPGEKIKREALALILGLLQHADNKAPNQRLSCTKADASGVCQQAWLVAQDLGGTFGQGYDLSGALVQGRRPTISKFVWTKWKAQEVWKERRKCELHVRTIPLVAGIPATRRYNTFTNKVVSEAGRAYAARLLAALTDRQIHEIFMVAQVDLRHEVYRRLPAFGSEIPVTTKDWEETFKAKREDVITNTCTH